MGIIEIGGISIFLAFAAGMLSVLSPCLLPLIPAYLGYLTGAVIDSPKSTPATTVVSVASGGGGGGTIAVSGPPASAATPSPFFHAIAFVSGFSLVFMAFGASIGLLGFFLGGNEFFIRDQQDTILKVSGGALIILGLHLSGVITIPFLDTERRLNVKTGDKVGYTRSFIVGSSFSAGGAPASALRLAPSWHSPPPAPAFGRD